MIYEYICVQFHMKHVTNDVAFEQNAQELDGLLDGDLEIKVDCGGHMAGGEVGGGGI